MLELAGKIARPNNDTDKRSYWLAAIGIRSDGVLVSAKNGSIQHMFSKSLDPDLSEKSCEYHAEGRALRKMDKGGILYVSRVSRKDGSFVMARPCYLCQSKIRFKKIEKVYYTINNEQYGIFDVKTGTDRVYNCT
jgi:deoxycytidylate deaminase